MDKILRMFSKRGFADTETNSNLLNDCASMASPRKFYSHGKHA